MTTFKLKIDEAQLKKLIDDKLNEITDYIFTKSQENIVKLGIVDEGTLLKSGNVNRQFLSKEIIYAVPYADSIEFGRLPGSMPPTEPIKGWVRRKLKVKDENDINKIAWAIAQDIKKNGTEPRPFLYPAIQSAKTRLK